VNIIDNGLTTLDTPNAGTGALVGVPGGESMINSKVAAAVNFDFSGLNGPNDIAVNRNDTDGNGSNNADVYTLGNFGTNNGAPTTEQQLTITNGNAANVATINFGSGAYMITDPGAHGVYNYVNTAANGAGLASGLPTLQQWGIINGDLNGDTLLFKGDSVQNIVNIAAAVGSVAAGIMDGLARAQHTVTAFNFGGNTYFFDHAGTSTINVSPTDALVEVTGIHTTNSLAAGGLITFHP
jgi:hypothetical protein